MSVINIEDLKQAAVKYDPALRYLPHAELSSFISEMHFNLQTVTEEDRLINVRRGGNLLRPYKGTVTKVDEGEAMHPEESVLSPKMGYIALLDNIQNYRGKKLLMKEGKPLSSLKDGEHPYEFEILRNVIKTFVEDFTLAIPHAKAGSADSPLGVFDGYNAIVDALIGATKISEANGNLIKADEIKAPTKKEEALKPLEALIAWVRKLDPMLRSGELDLLIPSNILLLVLDAFEERRSHQGDISRERLAEYLKEKCGLGRVPTIISNAVMGTGDRLIATRPGNITVGISAPADLEFVKVRDVYTDPNLVQFWMQADMGTRLDDWNKKVFATSGGTIAQAAGLAGDYTKA